jgi:hypothetical protein
MLEEYDLSSIALKIEEQNKYLKKELTDCKKLLQTQNETIIRLKGIIQYERMKNSIYTNIITSLTDVKLDDIIEENEDRVQIYNHDTVNIPIIVNDFFKGNKKDKDNDTDTEKEKTKQYSINLKKKRIKPVYRSTKQAENISENPEQQEEKIKRVEEKRENIIRENNLDVPYKDTINHIEKCFEDIKISRTYKKGLLTLKELRSKLLGKLTLENYIDLSKGHINLLEDIFIKKGYDNKKTVQYISQSLSPLEQRLLQYDRYYQTQLDTDDIQKFNLSLDVNMNHSKRYIPFSYTDVFQNFFNYSMAICSLKENLKRVLVNPYGFSNIIYLNSEKSSFDDKYSFYILEKVESDGKKFWKMEIRLDEFSKSLSQHLLNYLIKLFRKIYYDVFNDNIYRKDYKEKSIITSEDCEQILANIITLSKTKTFCNILRDMISEYCTIKPTKSDKFNLTADDKVSKRNFIQEKDSKDVIQNSVKRLFDSIQQDELEQFFIDD